MTDVAGREPWQWEEAEWRDRVNRVRAGRRLAPASWPDGKGFAVAISFDSDHETNELRDGGRSISRLSWGEYGSAGRRTSYIGPARAPRGSRELLRSGGRRAAASRGTAGSWSPRATRSGIHGWIHERNSALPYEPPNAT